MIFFGFDMKNAYGMEKAWETMPFIMSIYRKQEKYRKKLNFQRKSLTFVACDDRIF